MRRAIIFSALFVLAISGVASAQVARMRLTFSEAIDPSTSVPTGTVQFFVDGSTTAPQVYEAVIAARTEAECFASRDFSNARPVSSDRASLTFDAATGLATLKWVGVKDKRDSCRVLLAGRVIVGDDLGIWQANYGSGGLLSKDDLRSDGSVRPIRSAISLNPGDSTTTLSVRYPGQADELIEAEFQDSPGRHFVIFEGAIPAPTSSECLGNTDFTSLVPADPNRTSISSTSTGVFFLKNSNAFGSAAEGCRAVLADGDGAVDAADYAIWRSNYGSSGFSGFDAGRPRPPLATATRVSYQLSPVLQTQ